MARRKPMKAAHRAAMRRAADGVDHIRTPEGMRRYGGQIGDPIVRHEADLVIDDDDDSTPVPRKLPAKKAPAKKVAAEKRVAAKKAAAKKVAAAKKAAAKPAPPPHPRTPAMPGESDDWTPDWQKAMHVAMGAGSATDTEVESLYSRLLRHRWHRDRNNDEQTGDQIGMALGLLRDQAIGTDRADELSLNEVLSRPREDARWADDARKTLKFTGTKDEARELYTRLWRSLRGRDPDDATAIRQAMERIETSADSSETAEMVKHMREHPQDLDGITDLADVLARMDARGADAIARKMSGKYGPYYAWFEGGYDSSGVRLWANIYTDDYRKAGVVDLTVREREGKLDVESDFYQLSSEYRRKGFTSTLNRQLDEMFARNGVETKTLEAGLEDGGRVWARAGYQLDRPTAKNDLAGILREFKKKARDYPEGSDERALVDAYIDRMERALTLDNPLDDPDVPTPQEMATLSTENAPDLGGDLMTGTVWFGVLYLGGRGE